MKAKMKKHLIFLLVMIVAISTVYTALADVSVIYLPSIDTTIDITRLTDEELTALLDKAQFGIRNNRYLREDSIPVWNGSEKVLVYDDDYIYITFNGLYAWSKELYIPKLMITNKTDKPVFFKWKSVFFDDANVNPANGGVAEISANGRLAFQMTNMCAITLQDYIDAYDETMLRVMRFDFSLENGNKKTLQKGSFSVRCDMDLTNPLQ